MKTEPELLTDCKGSIKVLLRYTTLNPKHLRSHTLKTQFGLPAPYFEDLCILVSQKELSPLYEFFLPIFKKLKKKQWLDETAVLKEFQVLDEDTFTLAYKI